ncbi:MAG: peptidyl-prolyl cis-trans isomerase [Nitrospiraceae bacterium]|nr:MAG: peptidyl-prolyl cis-trans isomerase [Nitrospiraceae bacterium]
MKEDAGQELNSYSCRCRDRVLYRPQLTYIRRHVKKIFLIKLLGIVFVLFLSAGDAPAQKLPVIDGQEVVASVNNDPVTLGEYSRQLSSIHGEAKEEKQVGKIDYKGILDHLITLRLFREEAINMGLNELPEVKEAVDVYARQTLNGILRGEYVKRIEVDEEEIDRLYVEAAREYKLKAVLINNREDANKVEEEIKAGGNFDEIMKRILADKKVKESAEGVYFAGRELLPPVLEVLSKMETGAVSPVIEIKDGFLVFRLEDVRLPEDPGAKEEARKQAIDFKRKQALEDYKALLTKKYVKLDDKVLDSIDYESTVEDFEKLREDRRVIAQIEDEEPITVAELTNAINNEYYHGVEAAIKKRKLNDKKREFLNDKLLLKRLYRKEALKIGLDKSPVFTGMVKEYENSVLFDTFIRRVIVPDIKPAEEEIRGYYDKNITRYSSPDMMRINSIVFARSESAADAMERLKKGTEFKWLQSNAEGQVDKSAQGVLPFNGSVLTTNDLPQDVLKVVSGAEAGDIRLYTGPEKYYYVLYIQDVFPSKPLPFEELKEEISKSLFTEKLNKSIDDWAVKLREVYEVKVYMSEF